MIVAHRFYIAKCNKNNIQSVQSECVCACVWWWHNEDIFEYISDPISPNPTQFFFSLSIHWMQMIHKTCSAHPNTGDWSNRNRPKKATTTAIKLIIRNKVHRNHCEYVWRNWYHFFAALLNQHCFDSRVFGFCCSCCGCCRWCSGVDAAVLERTLHTHTSRSLHSRTVMVFS